MRKLLFVFVISSLFFAKSINAQSEIKLSPVILGGVGMVSFEYGFNENVGVEMILLAASGGAGAAVSGKYYLNPNRGLDRFHLGMFLGTGTDLGPGFGFLFGTKMVSEKGLLFEVGIGLGRTFDGGVIPYFKLDFGYRFGRKNK